VTLATSRSREDRMSRRKVRYQHGIVWSSRVEPSLFGVAIVISTAFTLRQRFPFDIANAAAD